MVERAPRRHFAAIQDLREHFIAAEVELASIPKCTGTFERWMVHGLISIATGHPARLAALVEAARLQATPEELAAWHVLHPFSDLERDLRMAGRSGVSVEAVVNLWRS